MQSKEGVMAAIMAAIDRFEGEGVPAGPSAPRTGFSPWKYWGLGEMMRARVSRQLRVSATPPLRRR